MDCFSLFHLILLEGAPRARARARARFALKKTRKKDTLEQKDADIGSNTFNRNEISEACDKFESVTPQLLRGIGSAASASMC